MISGKEWDDLNECIKPLMFKYGFLLPSSWKRKAGDLKFAADHLFEHYEVALTSFLARFSKEEGGTGAQSNWHTASEEDLGKDITCLSLITEYCLLMGYALENLLKGILMADHPEYFKVGQKITDIRSHNLVSLCNRCSFSLSDEEEGVLRKLTDYIEWVGKYPVPLVESGMYPKKNANGEWDGENFHGHTVKQTIDTLYSRFFAELASRDPEESVTSG